MLPFLLNQGAGPWAPKPVGDSTQSFAHVGCFLTSLTAATNMLRGLTLTPDGVNATLVKHGRCFIGADLILQTAATVLGLRADEKTRLRRGAQPTLAALKARIDETLLAGGLCIIDISYDGGKSHAHFVLCYGKDAAGDYLCMDPAGGVLIELNASLFAQRTTTKTYLGGGVAPVFKA